MSLSRREHGKRSGFDNTDIGCERASHTETPPTSAKEGLCRSLPLVRKALNEDIHVMPLRAESRSAASSQLRSWLCNKELLVVPRVAHVLGAAERGGESEQSECGVSLRRHGGTITIQRCIDASALVYEAALRAFFMHC